MVEVSYVDDLGPQFVEKGGECVVDSGVAVAVARPRHVDDVKADPGVRGVRLFSHRVLGQEGVLLPGEDVDLVSLGERLRKALRVHLGTRVVTHRVAVYYLQDYH